MKTALVTGSSRGIGRAIGDLLWDNGYTVIYSGARPQRPANLPPERDFFPCDISIASQREALMQHLRTRYGPLDALVNNAGIAPQARRDVLDMTEDSFDQVMGVNLKGTLFLTQSIAKMMLAQRQTQPDKTPRIVNIGSLSAYTSSINRGEYCISKAGVSMVTKLFAHRLAPEGIPVFEVRPGIIATDMTQGVHEKYQALIDQGLLPVPRFGQPQDVARMVLACLSGLLDYSAGQVLEADGGFALRRL